MSNKQTLETLTGTALHDVGRQTLWTRLRDKPHTLFVRKFVFNLHMWCGAFIALYIVVLSLTGAALVFRDELETGLGSPSRINVKNERLGFQPLITEVESTYPNYRVSGIINTIQTDLPVKVYAVDKKDNYLAVLIDPYSAKVIGLAQENQFLKFLQELHFNLLLERNGRKANGVGGGILCLVGLSGVLLWWKGLRTWARGLQVHLKGSATRINWDVHNAVGFWTLPFLLIWGLSGVYFGFRGEFERAVNSLFPVTAQVRPKAQAERSPSAVGAVSAVKAVDARGSIDDLVRAAQSKVPGQRVVRIAISAKRNKITQVWLTSVDSYRKDENTEVDLDGATGEVISVSTPNQRRSGDLILIWLTRLHFGTFGGLPIKCAWVCIGLTPAVLAVTGVLMWWHRSLRKKWLPHR